MIVLIGAAVLTALVCLWVLKPLPTPRLFTVMAAAIAIGALGIYLILGHPDLPAHPAPANSQARADLIQEANFMEALQKNPDDADTMIRLAALRLVQSRDNTETLRLLDRAEALKPHDRRIQTIRSMIANPMPAPR